MSNKVPKMYKPLKASIFLSVLDNGLCWGVKSNITCIFCLEINVCQHFNTISIYILGGLQLALTLTRPTLEIPELQPLVLWTWLRRKTISVLQLLHLWFICLFPWTEFSGNKNKTKKKGIISRLVHITPDSLQWKHSAYDFSF